MMSRVFLTVLTCIGLSLFLNLSSGTDGLAQDQERSGSAGQRDPERRVNTQPNIFDSEGVDVPLKLVFDYPKVVQINKRVNLRGTVSHNLPIMVRDVRFRVEFPSQVQVLGGSTSWTGSLSARDTAEIRTWARFPLVGKYEVQYVIEGLTEEGRFSQQSKVRIEAKK
jgi:hypothetical protein